MNAGTLEILMTAHNGAEYIEEQIESILEQTDENWHLTISDDGSADATPAIIERYVKRYPNRILRHDSLRCFGNARDHFFYLMGNCKADYMLFCDHDDVWFPEKVSRTREALVRAEQEYGQNRPILVFSDQIPADEALKPLASSLMRYQKQYVRRFDYRSLLMQNVVTGGAMGINRALAALAGRGEGEEGVIMHDWWLAVVAARFGHIAYIDEPLGIYRQHTGNAIGAKDVSSVAYVLQKLANLRSVRRTILDKKLQAAAFERVFESDLSPEDMLFLHAFQRRRSGPVFWLRYQRLIHGAARKAGMLLLC